MRTRFLFICFFLFCFLPNAFTQTTIFFQGFENSCNDTWPVSGSFERNDQGGVNYNVKRTGTFSARVGRGTGGSGAPGGLSNGPNTLTMSAITLTGYSGVVVKLYTSTHASSGSGHGSGTGMDTDESFTVQVRLNSGAWTTVDQASGFSNYTYTWAAATVGSTGGGCSYTMPNPLTYNVPAGTSTLELRVFSSRPCASTSAGNYDRADEGIYVDDIEVTTTSTVTAVNWTGASSTDWFCKANWSPAVIPTASINATITQTASNNCVVGGTGAAVCNHLTLSSSNNTNRTLTVQNSASLNCSGNVSISKTGGSNDLKMTLLNTATFSCVDLTITGTGSGTENAQFENETNTPNATINGNLTINNGGVLDLTDSPNYGILNIKGNYTNNGQESDYKQSNSILRFTGTGAQTISTASFTDVFSNVVVNKTSGTLTLNNPIDIENSVTFTNGVVHTSAAGLLAFYDGATASAMSNNSYVDGPVRKIGNDGFTFPVGDDGNYQPITISAPTGTSHHFTAQYFETDPNSLYDRTLKVPALDHISMCEYWILNRTNGSSNVTVTLNWDAGSCGVTALPELSVARWDGSIWQNEGNGGTTGTTASGTVVTAAAVVDFSPFTLSSITSENPLPIQLLDFTALLDNGIVYTSWATASEQNTLYHIVERSTDGINFGEVGKLDAAGNSNRNLYYTLSDDAPLQGRSYYRLKTLDMDGALSYSRIVPIQSDDAGNRGVWVANNASLPSIVPMQDVQVRLFNNSGQLVMEKELKTGNAWILDQLQNGVYLLQVTGNGYTQMEKVLVAR